MVKMPTGVLEFVALIYMIRWWIVYRACSASVRELVAP